MNQERIQELFEFCEDYCVFFMSNNFAFDCVEKQ